MRDHRIDNAKGILIFLVVLGHYLEVVHGWDRPLFRAVMTALYMFHVPAFVFLAGMTAKQDNLGQRIANLVVILIVFQVAYVAATADPHGQYPVDWLQPYWILWFLLSMIWWMALLPIITRLPAPLLLSTAIAVGSGLLPWSGYAFSVGRTLVFLPFFVAGNRYGRSVLAGVERLGALRFWGLLLIPAFAMLLYHAGIHNHWFFGSYCYESLTDDAVTGCLIRTELLAIAAVCTIAFLAAMPTTASWLSRIGRNSLAVYVLHGFVAKTGEWALLKYTAAWGEVPGLMLVIVATALSTYLLSLPVFDQAIRETSSGLVNLIFRKKSSSRPASGECQPPGETPAAFEHSNRG